MLACPIHFGEINFLATLFDNILLIYLERGDVHHYQIESLIGPDCLPEASLQLAAMHFDLVSGGVVIIIKPMNSDLIDHAKVFAPKVASILLSSLLSLFLAILFAEHAFCEFCPPTHPPPRLSSATRIPSHSWRRSRPRSCGAGDVVPGTARSKKEGGIG